MSVRANVDAREFDQRVTFERDYGTQDASGDVPPNWRTLVTCWARVDGAKAGEANIDGLKSRTGYTVWVRSDIVTRLGVTQKDRIRWGTRLLNILDLPDQQLRGRKMPVMCDSGVNAG